MARRKLKEVKQQPSMFPGPAVPSSCLASFHFRWAIHPIRPVQGWASSRNLGPTLLPIPVCCITLLCCALLHELLSWLMSGHNFLVSHHAGKPRTYTSYGHSLWSHGQLCDICLYLMSLRMGRLLILHLQGSTEMCKRHIQANSRLRISSTLKKWWDISKEATKGPPSHQWWSTKWNWHLCLLSKSFSCRWCWTPGCAQIWWTMW